MKKINRKNFLRNAAALSFTGIAAINFLSGCSDEKKQTSPEKPESEKGPCGDLSGLSEAEKDTRDLYRYEAESPNDDKKCSICNYYVLPKAGSKCGTCIVVKGPINPKGYCSSFVKKIS